MYPENEKLDLTPEEHIRLKCIELALKSDSNANCITRLAKDFFYFIRPKGGNEVEKH